MARWRWTGISACIRRSQPLMPLWNDKKLAFIHAAGSPDPSRSHFDAQLFIENGTPGARTTPDGWMNRLLAALPGPRSPTDALSVGPTLPLHPQGAGSRSPICRSAPRRRRRWRSTGRRSPAPSTSSTPATTRRARPIARAAPRAPQLVADMASDEQKMADNGAPPRQRVSGHRRPARAADRRRTAASGWPLSASAAGTPMSARATTRASSPTG